MVVTKVEDDKRKENNLKDFTTKFKNDFSKEIYEQTYKFGEEDIDNTLYRVAKDLASIEEDPEKWTYNFLDLLTDFKFVPGGRITSNAGTSLKGTSMINCFTPEVEVLTKRGYVQIKDVKINDEVLTHTGKWRKVKSIMNRIYKGNLDVYDSSALTSKIKSTPEHPFYQGDNKWEKSENNNKLVLLSFNDDESEFHNIDILEYVKNIKRIDGGASELYYDDNILHTTSSTVYNNGNVMTKDSVSINRKVKIDENIAYCFGRFVGDGSTFNVNKRYEVDGFNIIFSKKEKSELLFIKESLENAFGIDININESNAFDGVYLRKNNNILGEFFKSAFGKDAYCKKIPKFIWESPKKIIESFLLGLFDADGTFTKNKELRITLSNEKLVKDIQALMNMIGFSGRKTETSIKEFKSWKLYINKNIGNDFIQKLKKYYDDDRFNYNITNNGLSPIVDESSKTEKIHLVKDFIKSKEYYEGIVYNISVDTDESYVVNNVVVHNCFVDGFLGEDQDSMESILDALRRQALILKSEGGYGFCADVMRPRGAYINGIGNESPGAVKMLDMWDTQSSVITEGSGKKSQRKDGKVKIRKGAQMVTMSCWHGDIEEFITAKQTPGRLTKFNMSVLITDEFMNAVENNLPWNLEFPDYDKASEEYKKEWNGNLRYWKEKGYPTVIYKTYENANQLWDIIMESTYSRNEPGVLFIDTINKLNNLKYIEYINATNPCVVGDTLVLTNIGWIKIKNLNNHKGIRIITMDSNNKLYESELKWSGVTNVNDDIIRVDFSNGEFLLCNKKHKLYNWSDFSEICIGDLLGENLEEKEISVISGLGKIVNILKISELGYKEDVYDLTAVPNYNFFSILNRDESIIKEKIIINDNIELDYFSVVETNNGQKFANELTEEDDII